MNKITIEWKHYDKSGKTCNRCNDTGENIKLVIDKVSDEPKYKNVKFVYKETKLKSDNISESNTVLINNQTIEDILDASVSKNHCNSCSNLVGKATECKTIEKSNKTFEIITSDLIVGAIETVISKSNNP